MSKSKIDLFCREVTLLSIVDHPNILKFVVSEYIRICFHSSHVPRVPVWKSRANLLSLLVRPFRHIRNQALTALQF